ncbi:MAG: hypothetical protein IKK60_08915 [Clostridia bacterium]|nr:hypothetical protein [Clostridia bacterium]
MENNNNNPEKMNEGYTYPAPDGGAGVQDTPVFSQGNYPQPPEWTKNIVISDKPWIPAEDSGNLSVKFNAPEKEAVREEEGEEDSESELFSGEAERKEWPMWIQIGVVALAAIIVFVLMRYVSEIRKPETENASSDVNAVTVIPTVGTTVPVTAPTTAPLPTEDTDKTTEEDDKTTSADKKEEKPSADKKPSSDGKKENDDDEEVKAEVIKYFNESSNRVKAEAVKVVKNFENRSHDEDKLELPAAIKGLGKSILESKITDITEPTEYATHEDIISKYPAPGGEWSSALRAVDVEEATCVETDDEYEITLKLYDCVDPEPGVGPSRAMDCIDVPGTRETAPPFITSFSAEYYDCVIRCRAEKETGRIIWSNYTSHVVVKVGLDAGFTQFDAQIGLSFEKDYTVTY